METSTDTLLTVLIVILSTLAIISMTAVTVLAISINKLLKKAHHLADSSSESVDMFKKQLISRMGLLSALRSFLRK